DRVQQLAAPLGVAHGLEPLGRGHVRTVGEWKKTPRCSVLWTFIDSPDREERTVSEEPNQQKDPKEPEDGHDEDLVPEEQDSEQVTGGVTAQKAKQTPWSSTKLGTGPGALG